MSSGVSIRSYSRNYIQQVRDICLFYVKKTSGKYEDNKVSTRYIHQMADEIIKQLSGVAAQVKRYESDPEIYQSLLDEWQENFPASLGSMGTPKAVAALLATQTTELEELREALRNSKAVAAKEMSEVFRSMDAQLQASRNGIISERRQMNATHQEEIGIRDRQLEEVLERERVVTDVLNAAHAEQVTALQRRHEEVLNEHKYKIVQLNERVKEFRGQHAEQVKVLKAAWLDKERELKDNVARLQQELLLRNNTSAGHKPISADDPMLRPPSTAGSSVSAGDLADISINMSADMSMTSGDEDPSSEDDEESDDGLIEESVLSSLNGFKSDPILRSIMKTADKAAKKGRKKGGSREKRAKISGAVARKVNEMRDELTLLQEQLRESSADVLELRKDTDRLQLENASLHKQLAAAKGVVDEQRRAIVLNVDLRRDDSRLKQLQQGARIVAPQRPLAVTQHTPHFLGRRDTDGIVSKRR